MVPKKKNFYSSIFSVILAINLCSIVVLSLFNYYVFHRLSGKVYLQSFLSYHERVTDLAFKNIDNQIMQSVLKISQLHFSFIRENEPLLAAQDTQLAAYPQRVQSLAIEMKKLMKTYPYVANIDICYEGTNTVVTGFDKVHFNVTGDRIEKYLPWYGQFKNETLTEGFHYMEEGSYLSDQPLIAYIKKISMPKWEENDIILAIFINPQSFTDYIDQQEGELSILTREGMLLYDSGGVESGQKKLEAYRKATIKNEDNSQNASGLKELHFEKIDITLFHSVSSVTGLTYLYSMDTARFYRDYHLTSRMFLINFFISIAFNLIVLILISYYNYVTYRKKVLTMSEKAGILMDQQDKSFEGSLNALTDRITDLHAAVQSSKGMKFQNAVRSVLLNRKTSEGTKELESYFNGDCICTYIVDLAGRDTEHFTVENLQDEFLPGQAKYDALCTTIDKDSLVVQLIFKSGDQEETDADFITRIEAHWENCFIASGNVFSVNESDIASSYKSALETQRYRYILPKVKRLKYEFINRVKRKESGSHIKIFEAMKKDMNNENLLDQKMHLEMLMESFKNGNYTIEYCILTLRDLVTMLYQIMQQNQLDMWIVFGYDIREYYKKIPDIDAFHSWCDSLCEMILKNIHQKKMSLGTNIGAQILQIIEDNLENNITLDYLAEQLKMRSDVASRTFRQVMGTGYSEYIKTRKLKRAVEYLEEGKSVKDIAERLGYSTSQYFIKVFKESYGMTPYQYKKKMEEEQR